MSRVELDDASILAEYVPVFDVDDALRHSAHIPATTPDGLLSPVDGTPVLVTVSWSASLRVMYHAEFGERTGDVEDPDLTANVDLTAWINWRAGDFDEYTASIPITGEFSTVTLTLPWTWVVGSVETFSVRLTMPPLSGVTLVDDEHHDLDLAGSTLILATPAPTPNLSAAATGVRTCFYHPI